MDELRAYDQGAHIQHAIERRNNVGNWATDGEEKTRTPGIRPQGNVFVVFLCVGGVLMRGLLGVVSFS
jgi:hypothetical protein